MTRTVNEPAPFDTSSDPEPVFTGQIDGKAGGRVTVFKKPNGEEYLRLRDFTAPDDADVHVELAKSGDVNQAQETAKVALDGIDLGALKTSLGDQNYDLPADLTKYNAVVIYNKRLAAILGSAKLEAF